MLVNAKCLFCEETITGERDYMLKGTGLQMDGRRRPKWLKSRPEFRWAWNGLRDKEFYLCPEHTDDEHYNRAFEWCETGVILAPPPTGEEGR